MSRQTGTPNKVSLAKIDRRLDNIEALLVDGGIIRDPGDAIAAIEFLNEAIGSGNIDPIAGRAHITRLKHFIENTAKANFAMFAKGRML